MFVKDLLDDIISFVFPPHCLLCGACTSGSANMYFCNRCLNALPIHKGPICYTCGISFTSQEGADHLCSSCLQRSHFYGKARALGPYKDLLKKAIQDFKYRNKTILAVALGRLLADAGAVVLDKAAYEFIVPIPLHPMRVRQRGFNQSLMLARQIGKLWDIPVGAEALVRNRWTRPQTVLPLAERHRNIKGAFSCTISGLNGKNILLIDDVYTSGATVNECARILKKQGAREVDVLTLARTN